VLLLYHRSHLRAEPPTVAESPDAAIERHGGPEGPGDRLLGSSSAGVDPRVEFVFASSER
jgi:hypothetical protein